ncbi:MAG: adenine phosphoribosyltransferase [Myxococcota bacterium]
MPDFARLIRAVPDFPKPGILFRDITPALEDPHAFREMIDLFAERYAGRGVTKVAGIESRGFILASALAYALSAGLVILRKPGKLPRKTVSASYALEYGESTLHLHTDAIHPQDTVIILDDLVATGGTLAAAVKLVQGTRATLLETAAIIELEALAGRKALPAGVGLHTLLKY